MSLKEQLNIEKLPAHVAIIMDGNGRWAQLRGKDRSYGHEHGVKATRNVIEAALDSGVSFLTLYTFSMENWKRPKAEVDMLMNLFVISLKNEIPNLLEKNVRVRIIGDRSLLAKETCDIIEQCEKDTENNHALTLCIALSYSSRWEIVNAVKTIVRDARNEKEFDESKIDDSFFADYLTTKGIPDPDLLIRTGGEQRISNFLLWQCAYSELLFTDTLWPDFGREEFFQTLLNFENRERRFGKTGEQVSLKKNND